MALKKLISVAVSFCYCFLLFKPIKSIEKNPLFCCRNFCAIGCNGSDSERVGISGSGFKDPDNSNSEPDTIRDSDN